MKKFTPQFEVGQKIFLKRLPTDNYNLNEYYGAGVKENVGYEIIIVDEEDDKMTYKCSFPMGSFWAYTRHVHACTEPGVNCVF